MPSNQKTLIIILTSVVVVLALAGGYFLGNSVGYSAGKKDAITKATLEGFKDVTKKANKITDKVATQGAAPETYKNPFDTSESTNPFKELLEE